MRKFCLGVSVAAAIAIAIAISFAPSAQGAPGATNTSGDKAATQPNGPGAVKCGKLLDVRSGKLLTDQVISFDATGTVTGVGPTSSASAPSGGTTLDLSHATCLPGLIDVHTHITGDPTDGGYASLGISVPEETVHGVKNARVTLHAGFTTIRNVGASGYTDVAVRDGVNEGLIEGPRMLVSGPPLGITGGHCDDNLLAYEFHHRAEFFQSGQAARGLNTIQFRHGDVHDHDVRVQLFGEFHRLLPVACLAHDLHVGLRFQDHPKALAHQGVIVGQ